jgi:hypothetical protein
VRTASDGAIATTAFGGVPSYDFAWSGPGGFTAITEDITGLAPGDYDLVLTDANNCVLDTTITVGALISVVADAGLDQEVCAGTGLVLDGSASTGVVTWSWRDANSVELGNAPTLTLPSLPAGVYVFTLVVSDGPCTSTDEVIVTSLALPIADAGADQTIFLSDHGHAWADRPLVRRAPLHLWVPDSRLEQCQRGEPDRGSERSPHGSRVLVTSPNGCVDTGQCSGHGGTHQWSSRTASHPMATDGMTCGRSIISTSSPKVKWRSTTAGATLLFRSVGYTQSRGMVEVQRCAFVPVGTYYYVIEAERRTFPRTRTLDRSP